MAAPAPSDGRESDAGAAQVEGPGTGLAGTGTGRGAGGDGMGGGGTRAELVSGEIRNRDYPRAARKARAEGVVEVNYDVGPDGRVRNCRVTLSSGNAALDITTCRLIEDRFRYEPARNGRGQPTTDVTGWRQTWWFEGR
ncbi:MAG: energy transducer TonB [Pseudomonadota bacterium]